MLREGIVELVNERDAGYAGERGDEVSKEHAEEVKALGP